MAITQLTSHNIQRTIINITTGKTLQAMFPFFPNFCQDGGFTNHLLLNMTQNDFKMKLFLHFVPSPKGLRNDIRDVGSTADFLTADAVDAADAAVSADAVDALILLLNLPTF